MTLERSKAGIGVGVPMVSQVLGGLWNSRPKDRCQLPRDTRLVRGRAGQGPRLPAWVCSSPCARLPQSLPGVEGEREWGHWVSAWPRVPTCHFWCDLSYRLCLSGPQSPHLINGVMRLSSGSV